MRRPSLALMLARRARADCEAETMCAAQNAVRIEQRRWSRKNANPAKTARMAKRKAAASTRKRRPREEIDRNYFLGDVFIRTGVAATIAIVAVMLYAPNYWLRAMDTHRYAYLFLLAAFLVAGFGCFMVGRHLRKEATQWEAD